MRPRCKAMRRRRTTTIWRTDRLSSRVLWWLLTRSSCGWLRKSKRTTRTVSSHCNAFVNWLTELIFRWNIRQKLSNQRRNWRPHRGAQAGDNFESTVDEKSNSTFELCEEWVPGVYCLTHWLPRICTLHHQRSLSRTGGVPEALHYQQVDLFRNLTLISIDLNRYNCFNFSSKLTIPLLLRSKFGSVSSFCWPRSLWTCGLLTICESIQCTIGRLNRSGFQCCYRCFCFMIVSSGRRWSFGALI